MAQQRWAVTLRVTPATRERIGGGPLLPPRGPGSGSAPCRFAFSLFAWSLAVVGDPLPTSGCGLSAWAHFTPHLALPTSHVEAQGVPRRVWVLCPGGRPGPGSQPRWQVLVSACLLCPLPQCPPFLVTAPPAVNWGGRCLSVGSAPGLG